MVLTYLRPKPRGIPGLLLAMLVLLARLAAPATAHDAAPDLAAAVICHAHAGTPEPPAPPHHTHGCLDCPACGPGAHQVLPASDTAAPPPPRTITATHQRQAAPTRAARTPTPILYRPTGPPAVSV